MPLGTLDRTPPPFFKQGPSALSKLMFFSALALFLMVADARFRVSTPVRAAVATALYPLQWVALQPVRLAQVAGSFFTTVQAAQKSESAAREKLAQQTQRAGQVEQLTLENARLRKLLELRERLAVGGQAAQVLYDAADPFTRKVIIDKGLAHGIVAGSPVLDESGVLGQVTRVYPLVSEVNLLVDRDQAIPVLNLRTGARGVAYGDPLTQGGTLDLRYTPSNADVRSGDLLATSGVDGVYPAGLPVAKVSTVDRNGGTPFARILCAPLAGVGENRTLLVLNETLNLPPRPEPAPAPKAKSRRKRGSDE